MDMTDEEFENFLEEMNQDVRLTMKTTCPSCKNEYDNPIIRVAARRRVCPDCISSWRDKYTKKY